MTLLPAPPPPAPTQPCVCRRLRCIPVGYFNSCVVIHFKCSALTQKLCVYCKVTNWLNKHHFLSRVSIFFLPIYNKKVLLRERKRHTACRVASTPVVLTGYLPPPPAGYLHPPSWPGPGGVPCLGGGGVLYLGTPPGWTWQGTAPPPAGPGRVPPLVSAPWHSGKCCKALWDMGTPPQVWTN